MPRLQTPKSTTRDGRGSAATSLQAPAAVRKTNLPGGLRVVTEHLPHVHSASVGVWVNVGSRDEGPSVAGAAHFLEHLLFKSTPSRTAVEIAQAMDAVGGELNAFTAREHATIRRNADDMRGTRGDCDDVLPIGHVRQVRIGKRAGEHLPAVVERENSVRRAVDCKNVAPRGNVQSVGDDGAVRLEPRAVCGSRIESDKIIIITCYEFVARIERLPVLHHAAKRVVTDGKHGDIAPFERIPVLIARVENLSALRDSDGVIRSRINRGDVRPL